MIAVEIQTREKIILSARDLFYAQGIKKTNMAEIADHAGVTRITVYRHFADKKDLVRAAFLRIEQIFQEGLRYLELNQNVDLKGFLDRLGEGLSALPAGDFGARVNELKRLYPDVYADVQEVRVASLNGIFDHLFSLADRRGLLRPGLSRQIVQAIFWDSLINIFDNPEFKSFGLSNVEMYRIVTDTLLYGILKGEPPGVERDFPIR